MLKNKTLWQSQNGPNGQATGRVGNLVYYILNGLPVTRLSEKRTLIDSILQIKWQNFNASIYNKADDKATFVVYNPAKEKFVSFVGVADREAEQADLKLPAEFTGDTVHCWMQYVDAIGDKVSTSTYLGEIVVG